MRKGITPVIAIIILLFITIALAGAAWTYLQGFLFGQIATSFSIPPGGAYCQAGRITVLVQNTAYQTTLTDEDFIVIDVVGPDGTTYANVGESPVAIEQGKAGKIIDGYGCGTDPGDTCDTGYYTVNIATSSNSEHPRIYCP
jgi:flagellin-like protein